MNYRITHYAFRQPQAGGWIKVPFVTQILGEPEEYLFGFDILRPYSKKQIAGRVSAGRLIPLRVDVPVELGQSLWITPQGDIYRASSRDPIGDSEKWLVGRNDTITFPDSNNFNGRVRLLSELTQKDTQILSWVLETRKVSLARGQYLNSKEGPGKLYYPRWQQEVTNQVLIDLQSYDAAIPKNGLINSPITAEHLPTMEHRYLRYELRLSTTPLPWEWIFLTKERRKQINIIQMGNVDCLCLVYVHGESVGTLLGFEDADGRTKEGRYCSNYREWIQKLNDAETLICAPTDQAPDHLLLDAIQSRLLPPTRLEEAATISNLLFWLRKNRNNGVVACDLGIASQMISVMGKNKSKTPADLRTVLVPYDAPVPVGIAYTSNDAWGGYLEAVICDVLSSKDPEIIESVRDTISRSYDLGILPSPLLTQVGKVRPNANHNKTFAL